MKYLVTTTSEVLLHHTVEAGSPQEALEKANGGIYVSDGSVRPCDERAELDIADEWHLPDVDEVERVQP